MNTPGLGHPVGQLRNDVDDIYDILGVIKGQLGEHASTLAEHTERLDAIDATLAEHTATLADHTSRLERLESKVDRIIELLERRKDET